MIYLNNYYGDKKLMLPKLQNVWENDNYHIVWKLWIGYIGCISSASSDYYIKFTIKMWMEVSLTDYEYHSFICNYLININLITGFKYNLSTTRA